MSTFPDAMIDIETTGTSPDRTAMIQVAGVRFNLYERTVDHHFFNRSLLMPPHRFWDEGTRQWWNQQKRGVLQGIMDAAEDPRQVLQDFTDWGAMGGGDATFWSKPTTFDFMFIQSYVKDYELAMPWSFRRANDMNSFLRALYFPNPIPPTDIEFGGDAHNALFDVLHQIKELFWHADNVGLARAPAVAA